MNLFSKIKSWFSSSDQLTEEIRVISCGEVTAVRSSKLSVEDSNKLISNILQASLRKGTTPKYVNIVKFIKAHPTSDAPVMGSFSDITVDGNDDLIKLAKSSHMLNYKSSDDTVIKLKELGKYLNRVKN